MAHEHPLSLALLLGLSMLLLTACLLPPHEGSLEEGAILPTSGRNEAGHTRSLSVEPPATPTPDLLALLAENPMPSRHALSLVGGLVGGEQNGRPTARQESRQFDIGDEKRFWVGDLNEAHMYEITATLRAQTECVQMWVEEDAEVEQEQLRSSAEFFTDHIYPTNHEHFGSEWSPGIDGDPHLVILNARLSGAAGYFACANEYPRRVNPHSNEHEMFVMNIATLSPGTQEYNATLAHEFQHMIHWHLDSNEDAWLNEGASELAEDLNGFAPSGHAISAFERIPDLQLNSWTGDPAETAAHYGASYALMRYFLNRFGPEMVKALVQEPTNGIRSFDVVLKRYDTGMTCRDKEQQQHALEQIRKVRQQWKEKVEKAGGTQSELRKQWKALSIEMSQAQGRHDHLQANLDALAEQAGLQRVLEELEDPPKVPGELGEGLGELVRHNKIRWAYEKGLLAVAEALGLLKAMGEGLGRFDNSVETVLKEQQQFGLSRTEVLVPDSVAVLNQTWKTLGGHVKDEKYMGTHPLEFSRIVDQYIRSRLSDEQIQTFFEELGQALNKATSAWN